MNSIHRIGIVGAGNISRLHLEGMSRHPDRVRAVAICDLSEAALRERAAEWKITETYTSVGEMITSADIDAAIVCTPTPVREAVILPLIQAGLPVLCEKPFAETYAEATRIERAAQEAGVAVAVNQNFRRHFTFHIARQILASGALGAPLHLVQSAMVMRHDAGWRLDRRRYVMAVMSIHWFDGYRWMLSAEPETVFCQGANSPATEGGEDTAVSVVLSFPGGPVVSLSESFSSFTKPGIRALDCERGGLVMGYDSLTEIRTDGERVEHPNPYDKVDATYYLLDDLLRAVEEGREPETSAADNVKSVRILEAAYRSFEEGRGVKLEEVE